jgi:hypothetical protein
MKKSELKQIIKEEISKTLNEQEQKCLVVKDTSGRIYGVFLNKEAAEQKKVDAEQNLGFEGSSARVIIVESVLYM